MNKQSIHLVYLENNNPRFSKQAGGLHDPVMQEICEYQNHPQDCWNKNAFQ